MFDNLTPEENDAWRAAMLRAIVKTSRLCSFVAADKELWERAHGVMTDCVDAVLDLAAAI